MAKTLAPRATSRPEEMRQQHADPKRNENPPDALPRKPSDEDVRTLVAAAAYFRAENRGFAPGYELEDWLLAEAEVLTRFGLRTR